MKTGKVPFWRKNIGLKVLALSFSIFLWFFVVGEEKAEVGLSIPLEIVNMPNNMVISSEFPGSVDVRVYGPRSLLRDLANRPMNREIDLAGAMPGKMTVRFSPETIKLPRGVQVTRIQPTHINLILEPLARREVPVKPVIKGGLGPDFEMISVILDPPAIVISGAAREISKIDAVNTQPIDISGLNSDTQVPAYLNLEKAHFKIAGDTHLKAYFKIRERRIETRE